MSQVDLFAAGVLDAAPVVGDEHDRLLTPLPLAHHCVHRVLSSAAFSRGHRVLEPSVGGGAFVRAVRRRMPKLAVTGVDKDPMARGLELCDTAAVMDTLDYVSTAERDKKGAGPFAWILGNLPFSVALEHVEALLSLQPYRFSVILPLDRIGRVGWQHVIYGEVLPGFRLREVAPIIPRPWGEHVRETALYTWGWNEPGLVGNTWLRDPILWKEPLALAA